MDFEEIRADHLVGFSRSGIKTFYPIEEYSGIDTICGIGATPSLMRVKTAKIAAGDTVGFAVSHQRYSYSGRASDGREHEATDSVSEDSEYPNDEIEA